MSNYEQLTIWYALLAWVVTGLLVLVGFSFSPALFGFGLGLLGSVPVSRLLTWMFD